MSNFVTRMLGIAPTPAPEGKGVIPSRLGLYLGVDKKSGYAKVDFDGRSYSGDKKILVLCTEGRYLETTNGMLFSTGHNVQETAVPLMHLMNAGFDFDVVTPTGAPAVLEKWSEPREDEAVLGFMKMHASKFQQPLSLAAMVRDGAFDAASPYAAVFFPGGHGAMIGLPDDVNVAKLIRWTRASDRMMVVVCHGPAALVASKLEDGEHPYAGHSMVAFPDSADKQSPMTGYLPGQLQWFQCEALEAQGMTITNTKITGATHVDRNLYSGDSPMACDDLGKLVANALLDAYAGSAASTAHAVSA